MSEKALRPLGISKLDDVENPPTKGVLVRVTPEAFQHIKAQLIPVLSSFGDQGRWTTGGAGSFDSEHPWAHKGTTKIDSGDVDVYIDADNVRRKLQLDKGLDEKTVRKTLASHLAKHYPTTQTGVQIHIGFPTGHTIPTPNGDLPTYFQVDLPTVAHADDIYKHHEHDYSTQNSPYGGQDQQLALASLVNTVPGKPERTYQYHGLGGALKDRTTGEVVTRDINKVAQIVFANPSATQDWLGNVESMISHLDGGINSPRLAQFSADMAKKYPQLTEGTIDWFKAIRAKIAVSN